MQSKEHWEQIYTTKAATSVSWFQEHARQSVQLIRQTHAAREAGIIDIGGGASTLVDDLLCEGYLNLTVLDLSEGALSTAKERLGKRASEVSWLVGDITRVDLPRHAYDVWHDRAVFHFLTTHAELAALGRHRTLASKGSVRRVLGVQVVVLAPTAPIAAVRRRHFEHCHAGGRTYATARRHTYPCIRCRYAGARRTSASRPASACSPAAWSRRTAWPAPDRARRPPQQRADPCACPLHQRHGESPPLGRLP